MIVVDTPRGKKALLHDRPNTCDLSIIGGTFRLWGKLDDEYGLAALYPKTFLDIGGHIGVVTVAVLLDNPECNAVILEPLPENIEAIKANLIENGVRDRALVLQGAIGTGDETRIGYRLPRTPEAQDTDQFVGAPVDDDYEGEAITVPTYPLAGLLGPPDHIVDLAKVDCEGCEWTLWDQPGVDRVRQWVGEYHPGGTLDTLALTHDVTTMPHASGGTGNFSAVLR